MVLNDTNCAPRDLKQVQNAKYRAAREKRNDQRHYRRNPADEMQILLSDFHSHPFIQEIIQTKGKPPSVILYLEDNLEDINKFCTSTSRNPSVLGIDRTFNLGACYATTLVYQHNNLVRKGKTNPPIMLAAIYLHWDGHYTTYHRFFIRASTLLLAAVFLAFSQHCRVKNYTLVMFILSIIYYQLSVYRLKNSVIWIFIVPYSPGSPRAVPGQSPGSPGQ